MLLTDSHCHLDHLDLSAFDYSLSALARYCRERGVGRLLSVATDLDSARRLDGLLGSGVDGIYTSVGVHPLQTGCVALPSHEELVQAAMREHVIAIGETGLDRHYGEDNKEWQRQSFIIHAQVAKTCGKPLIVHSRAARDETLAVLRNHVDPELAGVLHCFTESWEMARAALDFNFYISISGIVTFKNALALRETVKNIPIDRLLIETDAPWLAPVPYRGRKNHPEYLPAVARCVAELKNIPVEELAETTNENFDRLFRISGKSATITVSH